MRDDVAATAKPRADRGAAPGTGRLTIAHVDAESGFSGGEVQVFLLLEGLRRRGHRGVLLCPPGSRCEAEATKRGLETRAVRMPHDLSLPAVARLSAQLAALRPDLVHLHTGRATWLGGLAAWTRGLPALCTRRMDRPLRRGMRSRLLFTGLVRRVAAISPAIAAQLVAAGVPRDRVRCIASAVDPEALAPSAGRDALRRREGLEPRTPCLLVLASLHRRKGIDVLLEAFDGLATTPPPVLWIAGDGPERAALERRAARIEGGERVRFLGSRDDAADLLAACDVAVLPSRREGLGVAALEAMAAGRPLVASDVGGLGETVVHERTGLLVPPEDPQALREALSRLLADAALRARLGAEGPQRIREGYLASQMVDAYEALYAEVLAEGECASA